MTEGFFEHRSQLTIKKHLREKLKVLEKITKEQFENFDLEAFLALVIDLLNDEYKHLFQKNYPELRDINREDLQNIKFKAYTYIRQQLEDINASVIEYLTPLRGFIEPNLSRKKDNIRFILTGRLPELDRFIDARLHEVPSAQIRTSIRKLHKKIKV